MWDTANDHIIAGEHLSHDLPCQGCGHAVHTFLPCGDACDCPAARLPGHPVAA